MGAIVQVAQAAGSSPIAPDPWGLRLGKIVPQTPQGQLDGLTDGSQ